jgi:hypothetical protein
MAIKPWKGAIREPSKWKEPENGMTDPPEESLEMKYVYGKNAAELVFVHVPILRFTYTNLISLFHPTT